MQKQINRFQDDSDSEGDLTRPERFSIQDEHLHQMGRPFKSFARKSYGRKSVIDAEQQIYSGMLIRLDGKLCFFIRMCDDFRKFAVFNKHLAHFPCLFILWVAPIHITTLVSNNSLVVIIKNITGPSNSSHRIVYRRQNTNCWNLLTPSHKNYIKFVMQIGLR